MKRITVLFAVFILILNASFLRVSAQELPEISIMSMDTNKFYTLEFTAIVEIRFSDVGWYNDSLKLSYHILNENGEMLFFEGERIPVPPLEDGVVKIPLRVNLSNYAEVREEKHVKLQLDIVDEINSFWMVGSPDLNVNAEELLVRRDFIAKQINTIKTAFIKEPVIGNLNLVIWAAFAVGIILFRKNTKNPDSRRLHSRKGDS